MPKNLTVQNYQTTTGRKLKLFSNQFYNNLEELGITLSMPLVDGKVEIIKENGEEIEDGKITNQNIKIKYDKIEGIKTNLKINGQEVKQNETILSKEGTYKIEITYQNTIGEVKRETRNIIIDKTVGDYQIVEDKIKNIDSNTKKSQFIQKFGSSQEYDIIREEKSLTDNEKIRTGDILKTKAGKRYTLIVTGDMTKDGEVTIKDIVKLRKYLLLKNNLDDVELVAADTNLDGKEITIKDLVKMRIMVLEKE